MKEFVLKALFEAWNTLRSKQAFQKSYSEYYKHLLFWMAGPFIQIVSRECFFEKKAWLSTYILIEYKSKC